MRWIQLGGHQGNLISDNEGGVFKLYDNNEYICLLEAQSDVLNCFIPKCIGKQKINNIQYIHMQDLLYNFQSPCIMDCKMGQRTFCETEVINDQNLPFYRKDLYLKMIKIDPSAPTEIEHSNQGVSKLRYMQWRESISSTKTYGFRIEAIRNADGITNRNYKYIQSANEIVSHFMKFVSSNTNVINSYLNQLKQLCECLQRSSFFATHEFIGSSLLFVHDATGKTGVWMIDFAKTFSTADGHCLDHRLAWELGNHEDGYLVGLDHVITFFQQLV